MSEKEATGNCPKIESLNDDQMDLSYEDKLKLLEREANSLYAFCLKKSFSEKQMVECVSKLYGPPKSMGKKALNDSLRSFVLVAILVALGAVVYGSPAAQNMIAVHYKLAMIKVCNYQLFFVFSFDNKFLLEFFLNNILFFLVSLLTSPYRVFKGQLGSISAAFPSYFFWSEVLYLIGSIVVSQSIYIYYT